jgi:hypothetical protein
MNSLFRHVYKHALHSHVGHDSIRTFRVQDKQVEANLKNQDHLNALKVT